MKRRYYKNIKNHNENADRCIYCGAIVPEGRQICRACEIKYGL